jgi:DNA-binding transcriptional ArsR family regulator
MADAAEKPVLLTDARAIRAIAHEARQQVINILYAEQRPQTATQLAARASLSPSAMSYHLRALEKWGVVVREDDVDGDGRNRPWRAAGTVLEIKAGHGAGDAAAADALFESMLDEHRARIHHLRNLPQEEQEGYTSMGVSTYWLTAAEIAELRHTLDEVLRGYRDRRLPAGDDRRRIAVTYSVLPVPDPREP